MARRIEGAIYKLCYGATWHDMVECSSEEDLFGYILDEIEKGYVVVGVNEIRKDGTTPRVQVFTNKEFKRMSRERRLLNGKSREMLTKDDLEVDRNIEIGDNQHEIEVYIELWCNVRKKLCIHKDENHIVDMYATYNPFEDTLEVDLVIKNVEGEDNREYLQFFPTDEEETLIKSLIVEKIKKEYNQTPVEFCQEFIRDGKGE